MERDFTILLVEDNKDDVMLLQRTFWQAHLANPLKIVSNGADAINYLQGAGPYADRNIYPLPSLLLLDLHMPVVDGFDVLQWLRSSRSRLDSILTVVLISSAEEPDLQRALKLGADSYLVKSAHFEELLPLLKRLGCWWVVTTDQDEVQFDPFHDQHLVEMNQTSALECVGDQQ
jgi:CheY-like chemotaxis protein